MTTASNQILYYKQLTENKGGKKHLLYCLLKSNAKHFLTKSYDAQILVRLKKKLQYIMCLRPYIFDFQFKKWFLHDY